MFKLFQWIYSFYFSEQGQINFEVKKSPKVEKWAQNAHSKPFLIMPLRNSIITAYQWYWIYDRKYMLMYQVIWEMHGAPKLLCWWFKSNPVLASSISHVLTWGVRYRWLVSGHSLVNFRCRLYSMSTVYSCYYSQTSIIMIIGKYTHMTPNISISGLHCTTHIGKSTV